MFNAGMTSDVSIIYQPDGTWTFMQNCSIISQDGNNFTIKDCMGNTKIFELNIPYDAVYTVLSTNRPMPIGFISFPDKLVVFSTNDDSETGGYGEIGILSYNAYGEGIQPSGGNGMGYTPIYRHNSLHFTKLRKTSGFAFPETTTKQNVYWTDNLNEIRVINVAEPTYTNYKSALTVGKTYMVLEGAIKHPVLGTQYGPGITATNIFTATTTSFTNLTGGAKVIEYIPYELLSFTPDNLMGSIQFFEYGTGNVMCGNKMYFYRLTTADGNSVTSWSYGSFPVHVGTLNDAAVTVSNTYYDFVGGGTQTAILNSARSVKVLIDNIDSKYFGGFIEMACAEFDQLIDVPRQITIVAKADLTASTVVDNPPFHTNYIVLEHTGNISLGDLTLNDITLFPANVLKCKTLTTTKNHIIIANTTERDEFTFDTSFITAIAFNYHLPTIITDASAEGIGYVHPVLGTSPVGAVITPYARYCAYDAPDASNRVSYNGTFYYTGDVFIGAVGVTTATYTGSAKAAACAHRNRYLKTSAPTFGSLRTEDTIEISGDQGVGFWDYREPSVKQHCTGLWSGEKYRWAILFYDKKRKPFYAKYITDYTMPTLTAKGGIVRKDAFGASSQWSLMASGMSFGNIFIPDAILDKIDGFSIVRAERVPRIITQGLVTQCTSDGTDFFPGAYIPVSQSSHTVVDKVYAYICPDQLVDYPFKSPIGRVNDQMEEATWVNGRDFDPTASYNPNVGVNASDFIMAELIEQNGSDGRNRGQQNIESWYTFNESDVRPFGSGNFGNLMEVGTSTTPINALNLDNHDAVGGKKVVFTLDVDFDHYNTSNDYCSIAAAGLTSKILMNYVNPGGGEYGATEDTLYISTGHYQKIDATVRAHTAYTQLGVTGCLFDGVEVFGGDCYTCMIDYGYALYNDLMADPYSYAWIFPCECNSNYNLRRGRKVLKNLMYYTGITPGSEIVFSSPAAPPVTQLEGFSYNQAYSSEGTAIKYPALPRNYISASSFKNRERFAGIKTIGELIDSFRTFLTNDYFDTDVQGGQINHIAIKNGKVIAWQDKMISTQPILERQVISGGTGQETALGTGGVLDRSDPLTTAFGCQHQYGIIETEFGFAWFDMRHKSFMVYDSSINEVSQILGLKGFFDEIFVETQLNNFNNTPLINPTTIDERCDRPLVGCGITGVYDPKFKITYMIFKFQLDTSFNPTDVNYVAKDFTIGYYHPKKMFVGFFDWFPSIAHNHNQIVLSANNPKNIGNYYGPGMASTTFDTGAIIGVGTTEFIFPTAGGVSVVSYDADPTNLGFVAINNTNEIWVHNQPSNCTDFIPPGYLYDSFFGRVVNNKITFVINPKTENPFTVYSYEESTPTDVRWTDVEIDADLITAADFSIRLTDKNYQRLYNKIAANFPIRRSGQRITNHYLRVTFTKKNWATDPRIVSNAIKILQWVKSVYRERK